MQLIPQVILLICTLARPASGETCLAPQQPFVPSDPVAVFEYADLIRRDFEDYIRDIQDYFRCLELERDRAFREATKVTEEYETFLRRAER